MNKNSSGRLNLNDSLLKSNNSNIIDRKGQHSTTPVARNSSGLYNELSSIRNDIRKQVSEKLKQGLLKQETTKCSPLKSNGLFANRTEQAALIHNDLLSAIRGTSSQVARKSPSKDSIVNRLSSLNEDFLKDKVSESSRHRLSPKEKNPLETLSKNLLALRGSANSSKGNLRPSALGTPFSEINRQGSPLRE